MELNSLMSLSEAGVVLGVVLEGTEYVPRIHKRWPALEKIGFLVLVLALVADWHFQSAINERQTTALIAANGRIAALNNETVRLTVLAEPRDLNVNQRTQVAKACEKLPQRGMVLTSYVLDLEAARFGQQILLALTLAHLNPVNRLGRLPANPKPIVGIEVNSKAADRDAAQVIAGAVANAAHLDAYRAPQALTDPESPIIIIVGLKPLPFLMFPGEEQLR